MTIDGVTLLLGPNNNIMINTATVPVILGSATGIDAKTTGGTLAYTNNTARTIIVYGYYALCTAATAITTGPTCSLGTSAGASDITAAIPLVALSSLGIAHEDVVGTVRIFEEQPGLWWGSRLAVARQYRKVGAIGTSLIRPD